MTTEYSVSVDNWDYDEWNFIGRDVEMERVGEWSEDNPDGLDCDDYIPVMLYAYPLWDCPSDEQIIEIHDKTSLTVVEHNDTGEYYLALCGGGMNLSQDIGMAYLIAEHYIPHALIREISTQPNLSQRGKNFRKLMRECVKMLKSEIRESTSLCKTMNAAIQESLKLEKPPVI
jgi:hypothetical protein